MILFFVTNRIYKKKPKQLYEYYLYDITKHKTTKFKMKKIILTAVILLIYVNMFAQTVKPCLFIATTSINNNICSDCKWIQEEVKDYQEYDLKRKQYR